MYAYLNGLVTEIFPTSITVEVNDVGYKLLVPNPYYYHLDKPYRIYLHQHVREDIIALFGFPSKEARELFVRLIGVSGIGPKSGLSILATNEVLGVLEAIENGNAAYLTKFPGIGQKTAQQIILDLKGKIMFEQTSLPSEQSFEEVGEALVALGYSKKEIQRILPKLDPNLNIGDMIRQALQVLLK